MREEKAPDQTFRTLVARAKTGDQQAFTELYSMTWSQLYRSVRAIVGSDSAAEDVLQEAYLKAFTQIDSLRQEESFRLWLRTIAINEARKYLLQRKTISFSDLGQDGTPPELREELDGWNLEEACAQKETRLLVRRIVDTLPDEQRIVVGLYYYEELSVREIAEQLSLPTGTVKFRLFSARKKLRRQIRQLEKKGFRLYQLMPLVWMRRILHQTEGSGRGLRGPRPVLTEGKGAALSLMLGRVLAAGLALAVGAGGILYARWGSRSDQPAEYGDVRPVETQQLQEHADAQDRQAETPISLKEPVVPRRNGAEASAAAETTRPTVPPKAEPPTPEDQKPAETQPEEPKPEEPAEALPEKPDLTKPEDNAPAESEPEPTVPAETGPEPTEPDESELEPTAPEETEAELVLSGDGWRFDPATGALTVTGAQYSADAGGHPWQGQLEDSEIRSLTVTGASAIGASAFAAMPALEQVTIEAPVQSIGSKAFYRCRKLESIRLPETLRQIGDDAFNGCTVLREIHFPSALATIGDRSFAYCQGLTNITLPEGLRGLGIYAFLECRSLNSATLSSGLQELSVGAFQNCKALREAVIPWGVTQIDSGAFSGCAKLEQVHIPGSVQFIGTQSFMNCTSLRQVTFPEGVTGIGWNAFLDCTALVEIRLPGSLQSLGPSAFKGCPALKSVTVPAGVTELDGSCLGYLSGWQRVEGFVLYGTPGSAAETYATKNKLTFFEVS